MQIPDVIGFKLGGAVELIRMAGLNIHKIKVAAPPRCRDVRYDESFRVIRLEKNRSKEVELLVCNLSKS